MKDAEVLGKVVKVDSGIFVVDPNDRNVARELLLTGEYSPEELALLLSLLRPTDHAVVVGAHIGAFAIPMARQCVSLLALEANPWTFRLLLMNARLNPVDNLSVLQRAAYSALRTEVEFLCNTHNTGGSKIKPVHMDPAYVYDSPALITVKTTMLDDECVHRVDFIHMDIEGGEMHALWGAQRCLSEARILSVEFIPHHLTRVAGVTLDEWLAPILPHFNTMLVPRIRAQLTGAADIREMLQNMMDAGAEEPAVIFSKT